MGFRFLLISFTAAFLLSCSAEHTIPFSYYGLTFTIPGNPTSGGASGREAGFVALKYKTNAEEGYLAFSQLTKHETEDFGCMPQVFISALFSSKNKSACNKQQLEIFNEVFIKSASIHSGKHKEFPLFYSFSKDMSFLFIVISEDIVLKIDSDFMSRDQFLNLINNKKIAT